MILNDLKMESFFKMSSLQMLFIVVVFICMFLYCSGYKNTARVQ